MTTGIWVLGDQLWTGQAALSRCEREKQKTSVILIESRNCAQMRPYHRQKLVLIWSAMRHFAEELRSSGWQVTYEVSDEFACALQQWVKNNGITQLLVMTPSDRPFIQIIQNIKFDCSLTLYRYWGTKCQNIPKINAIPRFKCKYWYIRYVSRAQ